MQKQKYMIDLKGIAFHSKANIQEYCFKFFKNLFFDSEIEALDYITQYVLDFKKTYKRDILPSFCKKYTLYYSYSVYQLAGGEVYESGHHVNVKEFYR